MAVYYTSIWNKRTISTGVYNFHVVREDRRENVLVSVDGERDEMKLIAFSGVKVTGGVWHCTVEIYYKYFYYYQLSSTFQFLECVAFLIILLIYVFSVQFL